MWHKTPHNGKLASSKLPFFFKHSAALVLGELRGAVPVPCCQQCWVSAGQRAAGSLLAAERAVGCSARRVAVFSRPLQEWPLAVHKPLTASVLPWPIAAAFSFMMGYSLYVL